MPIFKLYTLVIFRDTNANLPESYIPNLHRCYSLLFFIYNPKLCIPIFPHFFLKNVNICSFIASILATNTPNNSWDCGCAILMIDRLIVSKVIKTSFDPVFLVQVPLAKISRSKYAPNRIVITVKYLILIKIHPLAIIYDLMIDFLFDAVTPPNFDIFWLNLWSVVLLMTFSQ